MQNAKNKVCVLLALISGLLLACASPQAPAPEATKPAAVPTPQPAPTITTLPPAEPADIIFYNGSIITMEKDQPLAQAVAIRGNLIQAVGSDEAVLAFKGGETKVINLQGGALMPGFVEGHTHYTRNGWEDGTPLEDMMQTLLAFGLTSIAEMHSTDDYINSMLEAETNGEIDVRMNIFAEYNCGFLENGKSIECISWYRDNDPILDPTKMVRIPGVKIFVDGSGQPGRGCAYKSFPWPESIIEIWPTVWETCGSPYGDLYLNEKQLTKVIMDIQKRGYRAAFHTMGDAAIEIVLNSIETALGWRTQRFIPPPDPAQLAAAAGPDRPLCAAGCAGFRARRVQHLRRGRVRDHVRGRPLRLECQPLRAGSPGCACLCRRGFRPGRFQ